MGSILLDGVKNEKMKDGKQLKKERCRDVSIKMRSSAGF